MKCRPISKDEMKVNMCNIYYINSSIVKYLNNLHITSHHIPITYLGESTRIPTP